MIVYPDIEKVVLHHNNSLSFDIKLHDSVRVEEEFDKYLEFKGKFGKLSDTELDDEFSHFMKSVYKPLIITFRCKLNDTLDKIELVRIDNICEYYNCDISIDYGLWGMVDPSLIRRWLHLFHKDCIVDNDYITLEGMKMFEELFTTRGKSYHNPRNPELLNAYYFLADINSPIYDELRKAKEERARRPKVRDYLTEGSYMLFRKMLMNRISGFKIFDFDKKRISNQEKTRLFLERKYRKK